jgi:putative intracellular protease/amidase
MNQQSKSILSARSAAAIVAAGALGVGTNLVVSENAAAADGAAARILIIATGAERLGNGERTGVWLEEIALPYVAFRDAGHEVVIATPNGGAVPIDPRSEAAGEQQPQWAQARAAMANTAPVSDALRAQDFDAVFVPGGHGAMVDLVEPGDVHRILREAFARDRIVAAVCHGPVVFAGLRDEHGRLLLAGRRIAVFTDAEERAVKLDQVMPFLLESRLREEGAKVVTAPLFDANVQVDGNLITGQNPPSSAGVAEAVLAALANARANRGT